ncbi:MAG: hypothetical protein R6U38_13450 [Desulfatiglandaceae bacterium]
MDKVLNITHRLEDRKRKEQVETYRDRFDTVQRIVHCSGCQYKCAMCGRHMEPSDPTDSTCRVEAEFNLCDSCGSEYEEFRKMKRHGATDSNLFWHNEEWMALWAAWCEYQRTISRFRKSFDLHQLKEPPDN